MAMDKIASKKIFAAYELPQTRWFALRRDEYAESTARTHERAYGPDHSIGVRWRQEYRRTLNLERIKSVKVTEYRK